MEYYQAEVFLREGGQHYDVMDWTVDDILQDIIDQYERHLHFLSVVRWSRHAEISSFLKSHSNHRVVFSYQL